ncbi:retinol dehydrogenase 14 [Tetranychus urticae]|uniref:Uncharacterized protein n=1 Tax=Tetranychus urticae TaxID=32264 RepID=T1KBH7_TETUR|nr:retinol dehydrogenase 14 [Tetranychus urticae]
MANDILVSVGKMSAGIASAIIILRIMNLKSWRYFQEYNRLQGKTFVITGANCGIGKELTRQIVTSGGNVVMLCRDTQKGKIAMKEILQKPTPTMGTVTLRRMDLNSFASVENSAKEIIESVPRIDCLINNAGVMMAPFSMTEDGFESHMQSNHLGHALLTHLLLPKIASFGSPQNPTRVVFVSSTLYKRGNIIEDHFKSGAVTPENFDQKFAYSNSKLASLLFARELSNEVKRRGLPVIINSASPGMVYTNLGRHFNMSWYQKLFLLPFFAVFVRAPVEGARIILYAAASEKSLHSNGAFIQSYEEKPIEPKFDSEMCKKVYQLTMDAINKSHS